MPAERGRSAGLGTRAFDVGEPVGGEFVAVAPAFERTSESAFSVTGPGVVRYVLGDQRPPVGARDDRGVDVVLSGPTARGQELGSNHRARRGAVERGPVE